MAAGAHERGSGRSTSRRPLPGAASRQPAPGRRRRGRARAVPPGSEFRQLADAGHAVGGHGATHTRLTLLDDVNLAAELRASRALIDEVAPGRPRLFCYPDGAYNERVLAAASADGFAAACTVESGPIAVVRRRLALPRVIARDSPGVALA